MFKIYTYYIHSVVVQDFVSGWACGVNQYQYESLSCDAVCSDNRQDLIESRVQTHYVPLFVCNKFI